MARRRLAPLPAPDAPEDVPRAERAPETKSMAFAAAPARPAAAAPIARVAAEAASAAALEELSETLRVARETGRMVLDLPTEAIAPDHLARDRIPVEDEEMAALRESIRAHGQRTPIEVTPVAGALPYGLISGWRRLAAIKALQAETRDPRFATIQALVRRPETAADAYVAMVEENEIRLGLSQYERARVAALAARRGVFADEEAALRALFGTASRPKRSRIRAFLEIWRALDDVLRFPAHLPERLGLRLVERLRAGEGPRIAEGLARAAPETPGAELAALEALVSPGKGGAKAEAKGGAAPLLPGVVLAERLAGQRLTLEFRGRGVTPELRDRIRALLAELADRR
jgi:ParB family transcriptional regulator, chromosome partitioning protein